MVGLNKYIIKIYYVRKFGPCKKCEKPCKICTLCNSLVLHVKSRMNYIFQNSNTEECIMKRFNKFPDEIVYLYTGR